MHRSECLAEAGRLITEASSYLDRGMPSGAAWRCADALYWLSKSGLTNCGGIDKPTGLGAIIQAVSPYKQVDFVPPKDKK